MTDHTALIARLRRARVAPGLTGVPMSPLDALLTDAAAAILRAAEQLGPERVPVTRAGER